MQAIMALEISAMAVLLENSESAIVSDWEKTQIMSSLNNLRPTVWFMAEDIYIIISLAFVMLGAVTARHSLWLRPWVPDQSSKQGWCRIPFEWSLFGDKFHTEIARVTTEKYSSIAQDRR